MRASVGILGGIVILFIGYIGLSYNAQDVKDAAVANGTNSSAEAYNTTTGILGGIGQGGAPGIVWFGVAGFVLVALGLAARAASGGGR